MNNSGTGLIELAETPSTNDYLEALLMKERPLEGSMVTAGFQSEGKGQEGNGWESEAGKNMLVSVVLYPEFLNADQQFFITMAVSLSVCSLIVEIEPQLKPMIKWPNDIFINKRKAAGILIKNAISGNGILYTIAGVGLNVNQQQFSDNIPLAVSLSGVTGRSYHLPTLLTKWHEHLMFWYEQMKLGNFGYLKEQYLNRFYRLNEPCEYLIDGKKVTATIKGIGSYGRLKLIDSDGTTYLCNMKEVVFLNHDQ